MGKLCWPLDQAHWWEATATVFLAGLGHFVLVDPTGWCCSLLDWAPAFHLVEFRNVWVEVNPNQSLLKFRMVVEQIDISIKKGLQNLFMQIKKGRVTLISRLLYDCLITSARKKENHVISVASPWRS